MQLEGCSLENSVASSDPLTSWKSSFLNMAMLTWLSSPIFTWNFLIPSLVTPGGRKHTFHKLLFTKCHQICWSVWKLYKFEGIKELWNYMWLLHLSDIIKNKTRLQKYSAHRNTSSCVSPLSRCLCLCSWALLKTRNVKELKYTTTAGK